MRSKPRINASRCFLKAYATASPVIQRMAFRAIHDLVGRYRSDPRTCWRHYEKVAGLKESVKEVEIGYSQRMLVYPTPGGLTLLAVGGHDIVGSYGDGLLPSDLDTAECAPPEFWPDQKVGFFTREISYDVQPFTHTEYLPEWVYYLADEQDQAASDIMEGIEGLLTGDAHNPVRFTVGGPGTGKTCVLLSLLRRCQRMGISAQIAMPDAVLKYIQACTEFPSPAAYAGSPYEAIVQATSDVLLVDDPANLYEIRAAMHRVRAGDIRVAVFAFDPLQMSRALPDQDFDALVDEHDVDWYKLKSCYRQKANVGAATRKAADAIAKSSPYAARDKFVRFAKAHRELTALANDLTFINPHGYAEVYEEATVDDFAKSLSHKPEHHEGGGEL